MIKTKPVLVQIGYLQKLNTTVARILFGGNVAVGKSKKGSQGSSPSRPSRPKKNQQKGIKVATSPPQPTQSIESIAKKIKKRIVLVMIIYFVEFALLLWISSKGYYAWFWVILTLLFLNFVIAVPIFGAYKETIKESLSKRKLSLPKSVLLYTKKTRDFSYRMLILGMFLLPIPLTVAVLSFGKIPMEITGPLLMSILAVGIGFTLLFVYAAHIEALLGYSGSAPSIWLFSGKKRSVFIFFSKKRVFSEGLDEARTYLLLSREIIEKHPVEGIVYLKNSLTTLSRTFQRRVKYEIELKNVLKILDVMKKLPCPKKEIIKFIDKLIDIVEKRKFDKLHSAFSSFSDLKKAQYVKMFKKRRVISFQKLSWMLGIVSAILAAVIGKFAIELTQVVLGYIPLILMGVFYVVCFAPVVLINILHDVPSDELMEVLEKKYDLTVKT